MEVDNLALGFWENVNPNARFYNMSICDSELASVFKQERPEIVSHRAAQTVIAKSINEPLFDAEQNYTFREQVLSY